MAQNSMNLRGAIDLGAVAAAKEAQVLAQKVQATREANPVAAKLILDVTTDTFEELVIKQSALVPVVIDLWATWCEPLQATISSTGTAGSGIQRQICFSKN